MNEATGTEPARWISTAQAARSSGLNRDYIAQLCRVGKVRGEFIGKNWYVEPESFDTFLIETESTKAQRRTAAAIERKAALSSAIAKEVWERRRQKLFAVVLALTLTVGAAMLASATTRTFAIRTANDLSAAAQGAYDALAHRSAEAQSALAAAAGDPTGAFAQFRDTLIGNVGARVHAAQLAAAASASPFDALLSWVNRFLFPNNYPPPVPAQTNVQPPPAPDVAATPQTPTSTAPHLSYLSSSGNSNSSRTSGTVQEPSAPSGAPYQNENAVHSTTNAQQRSSAQQSSDASASPVAATTRASTAVPQPLAISGNYISADVLNQKLSELDNKLSSRMYQLTSANSAQTAAVYNVAAQTNAIDQLSNIPITNPTITRGSVSGASVSATSLSAGATTLGDTSLSSATVSGSLTVGGTASFSTLTSYVAPVAPYFTATSTSATSTFAGLLSIGTSSPWGAGLLTVGTSTALLYVDNSSGKVGVGTSSPGSIFSVGGNILGNGTLALTGTTGTTTIAAGQGFTIGGSQFVLQQGSGKIGIGTTTPDALLSLLQNSNGTSIISAYRITDTAPSGDFINYKSHAGTTLFRVDNSGNLLAGGIINSGSQTITSTSQPQFRVQYDPSNEWTSSVSSVGATTFAVNGSAPSLAFTPQSNAVNQFNFTDASSNSILSINTSGKRVGIGTTSPYAKLSISANSGETNTTILAIASSTASATTTLFTILNTGNVGIGTTTPGSILSVQGVANWTTATSTYYSTGGLNLAAGCFAIGGNCLSLGNISGTLATNQGGTGANTFGQGWIFSNGGTGALAASTSPAVNYVVATSTTLASIFPYASTTALTASGTGFFGLGQFTQTSGTTTIASGQGFTIGSSQFVLQQGSGNVGIGTTTPTATLTVNGTIDGHFDQSMGNTFWSGPTVGQHRFTDRSFFGGAVADSGVNTFPQTDWLGQLYNTSYNGGAGIGASGDYAQVYILTEQNVTAGSPGKIATPSQALVVGNQSLNATSTGPTTYSTPRALDVIMVNNASTTPTGGGPNVPAWGMYLENHRVGGQAGQTYGTELEVRNSVGAVTNWTPYAAASNGTIGSEIGCGAGLSAIGQFACTTAMYVAANPTTFGAGIIFLNGSIGAFGTGGSKPAIMMPYDYRIEWWNGATRSGSMYGDVSNNLHIDSVGNVAIGTTTPWGQLSASSTSAYPTLAIEQHLTGPAATFLGGNVGIATTSPATTLSVSGNTYMTGGLGVGLLNTTAGTLQTSGLITGGTTLALSGTSGTTTLASGQGFTIGTSQFVLQQGSSNVGIATANPAAPLQLFTNFNSMPANTGIAVGGGKSIRILNNDGNAQYGSYMSDSFSGNSIFTLGTFDGGTDVAAINLKNGNVGIGTTSPQAKLDVSGQQRISLDNTGLLSFWNSSENGLYGSIGTVSGVTGSGSNTDIALEADATRGLHFYTNGQNERLTITSVGNVGIGTTTPNSLLTVSGSSAVLRLADTAGSGVAKLSITDAGGDEYTIGRNGGTGFLDFKGTQSSFSGYTWNVNNGTSAMIINNSGNVGIGTTTPAARLDISTGANKDVFIGNGLDAAYNTLSLNGVSTLAAGLQGITGGSATDATLYLDSASSTAGAISLRTGGATSRLYINSSGNVGIGTTSPGTTLDVYNTTAAPASGNIAWDSTGGQLNITSAAANAADNGSALIFRSLLSTNLPGGFAAIKGGIETTGNNNGYLSFLTRTNVAYATERMRITSTGNVGIATTSPWRTLSVTGTVGFDGITSVSTNQSAYLCLSSNKEVVQDSTTCLASSARFKQNIQPLTASSSLAEVMALTPVSFQYTPAYNGALQTDPNFNGTFVGFIAEDVAKIDPRLITVDATGTTPSAPHGVRYENITALLAGAIQAQQADFDALIATTSTTTPGAQAFAANFYAALFARLTQWLGNASNGINDLFAKNIYATNITAKEVNSQQDNTQKLCVSDSANDPNPVCLTKSQLAAVLASQGTGQGSAPASGSAMSPAAAATDTPPVIQINGNNPATIRVGDTYNDLGATITGPQADLNLGLKTFLNGTLVSQIQIDTSKPVTDTIDYVATDAAGLTATSTRTLIIQAAAGASAATPSTPAASSTAATSTTL